MENGKSEILNLNSSLRVKYAMKFHFHVTERSILLDIVVFSAIYHAVFDNTSTERGSAFWLASIHYSLCVIILPDDIAFDNVDFVRDRHEAPCPENALQQCGRGQRDVLRAQCRAYIRWI